MHVLSRSHCPSHAAIVLALTCLFGFLAPTAEANPVDTTRHHAAQDAWSHTADSRYAVLLMLSEEATTTTDVALEEPADERLTATYSPSTPRRRGPALPNFAGSAAGEASPIARLVQLATAHRMKGETSIAEDLYRQLALQQPKSAIHIYFLAECAAANDHPLLAAWAREEYQVRRAGLVRAESVVAPHLSDRQLGVRLAAVLQNTATGKAIPGCRLRVFDAKALREYAAVSDANGLIVLAGLEAGASLTIVADSTDYVAATPQLRLDAADARQSPMTGAILWLQPVVPSNSEHLEVN